MNQSWSIIVFCYNEENTIGTVIDSVIDFFKINNIEKSEIIVVDDGSNDGTESIISTIIKNGEELKYIRFPKNMGIGKALLTGYKNASNENVVAIPGDGQFDISELKPYINFPEKSFVSFYRKELNHYSSYRKLITKTNRQFNKNLLSLNIKDVNWVKAYKSKDLEKIDLKLDSSLIGSEICSKLAVKKFSVIETESVYHKRMGGKSRGASLKTLSQAVSDIVKLSFVIRKFRKEQTG